MNMQANTVGITEEILRSVMRDLSFTDDSCRTIARRYQIPLPLVFVINTGRSNKYRREGVTYPLRKRTHHGNPVSTIPAKGSTPAIDTPVERGTPRI